MHLWEQNEQLVKIIAVTNSVEKQPAVRVIKIVYKMFDKMRKDYCYDSTAVRLSWSLLLHNLHYQQL